MPSRNIYKEITLFNEILYRQVINLRTIVFSLKKLDGICGLLNVKIYNVSNHSYAHCGKS